MGKVTFDSWKLAFIVSVGIGAIGPGIARAQGQYGEKQSITDSISSSFKRGYDKVAETISPQKEIPREADPIALSTESQVRPKTHIVVARKYEEAGNLAKADEHYQKALELSPDHLGALLGAALVKDRMKQPQEALTIYRRAAKAHPEHPSIYNNLGLFYNRHGMLPEAATQLKHAISIEPDRPNYRNNIAIVLVKMGRDKEAFEQLRAVQNEGDAYYNVGYLVLERGDPQAAARYLTTALRRDPSLSDARQLLAWMSESTQYARRPTTGTRLGNRPVSPGTTYDGRSTARQIPAPPKIDAPVAPTPTPTPTRQITIVPRVPSSAPANPPSPKRLPPTSLRSSTAPLAPMPPMR